MCNLPDTLIARSSICVAALPACEHPTLASQSPQTSAKAVKLCYLNRILIVKLLLGTCSRFLLVSRPNPPLRPYPAPSPSLHHFPRCAAAKWLSFNPDEVPGTALLASPAGLVRVRPPNIFCCISSRNLRSSSSVHCSISCHNSVI